MEQRDKIIAGGVYEYNDIRSPNDKALHRVILCDEYEVHFDAFWSHSQQWGMADPKKKFFYYRMPASLFKELHVLKHVGQLTELEFQVHRPDLPMRICRFSQWQWEETYFPDEEHYIQACLNKGIPLSEEIVLSVPNIILYGSKSSGRTMKGEVCEASNDEGFTEAELMWKAQNIQFSYARNFKTGTGIYRLGCEKKMPSYYIWLYYDKANIICDDTQGSLAS